MINQRNTTDPNLDDKIQVLCLNNNKKIKSEFSDRNKIENDTVDINEDENKKKQKICRICYFEEDSKDNPLIQPCKCIGSLKYIHLKCLKHWIMTKSCINVEEGEYCYVFLFRNSECELCKTKFTDLISHKNKLYYLLDFSEIFENYMLLETITVDDENNKFLYIISLEKNHEIKVGRGSTSDILISDASISRNHCLLSIEGKNIYLKDNNSKFGSLILIQNKKFKIIENLPLFFQIGRTFFNLSLIPSKKFFSCCGVSENPNIFQYYRENEKQISLKKNFTIKIEDNQKDETSEDVKKTENISDEIKIEENESIKVIVENE